MRFRVRALKDGVELEGFAHGGSLGEVQRYLKGRYDRLDVEPAADATFEFLPRPWKRPGSARLAVSFRQMAVMLTAGLPLFRCLDVLAGVEHPALADGFRDVRLAVSGGLPLSAALARSPHLFGAEVVGMVRAGETSGRLDETLHRITDGFERDARLRSRIGSALAYPACVLLLSAAVMALFVLWVLPTLDPVFRSLGAEMPLLTRLVVGATGLAGNPWVLGACAVLGLLMASLSYNYFGRTDEGRKRLRGLLLKVPVLGPALRRAALARLLFGMASLLSSGVRFDVAFRLLQGTTDDPGLEAALGSVLRRVLNGDSLEAAFRREPAFGRIVQQFVTVGETAGHLPDLLQRAAATLELEVETGLERMLALVEPAMLLFLGISSATLVLAAFLPLLELLTSL